MTTATKSKFAAKPSTTATRSAKRTATDTVFSTPQAEQPINVDAQRVYAERVAQAQDEYLHTFGTPSHVRMIVASVTQLAVFTLSVYWGMQAVGWVMAAAMLFTGSGFIAFVIALLGAFLTIRAAWRTGFGAAMIVTNFSFENVASIGSDIKAAAKSKVTVVTGWFKRNDEGVAA